MAQGFTRKDTAITIKDSPNLDAFSRLRVSNPLTIFSNQFTYDLTPLIFEQFGIGSYSISFDSNNRMADMIFAGANPGDYVYMQSYEYIPYQPGRSQLIFITFNMFPVNPPDITTLRFAGLGDDRNGFYLIWDGLEFAFRIDSDTGTGQQTAIQSSWNIDPLNGSGPSGINLDFRLVQILVIDFQALYVGRVRFGFDLGGQIVYAHEFVNNNNVSINLPYIATANLPVRIGMKCNFNTTDHMYFICCSVASEGGLDDSQRFGYNFTYDRSYTTLPSLLTYILSLRPKTTFNSITNRTKFILDGIDIINAGNKPIYWRIGIGGTITAPAYTDINATYSAMEVDKVGTLPTALDVIIDSGYVASGGGSKSVGMSEMIQSKYPITLDAAGNNRDLGTLRMFANGVGGTSDLYVTLKWKEIR